MDILYKIFVEPFLFMAEAPDLLIQTLWEGLVSGVLYALIALGFVLIFKASGVFNFAQGIMVVFSALILVEPFVFMGEAPDLLVQTLWEGLVSGVLYALIALGFVLIFKASGVFNFAQGIMVVFSALILVGLYEQGVPALLALILARHAVRDRRGRTTGDRADHRRSQQDFTGVGALRSRVARAERHGGERRRADHTGATADGAGRGARRR